MEAKSNNKTPPAPVITFIPDIFPGLTYEQSLERLRGKGKDPAQQAVLQLLRLGREDFVNAGMAIRMDERESGFYAGACHALRELERALVQAHITPMQE
jgi:hypothetical protein